MPSKTFEHYMRNLNQDYPSLKLMIEDGMEKKDIAKKWKTH